MPITLTLEFDEATVIDPNDRTRIIVNFKRFGWEHIRGSAWHYPALGTTNASEDWFNHVVPSLMYFRSLVAHAGITVTKFTIDAHSEAGHRGNVNPPRGEPIREAQAIVMNSTGLTANYENVLSESRLRKFVQDCADSLRTANRLGASRTGGAPAD